MRVILDSNVLLSAFIKVDSKPYKLMQAWLDGRFELVSSVAQLEEVTRAIPKSDALWRRRKLAGW